MKKKIFAVLMTTATVAGLLSGCGGNNESGSDSAAEGKVINIYSWNDEFRTRLEAIYPELPSTSG